MNESTISTVRKKVISLTAQERKASNKRAVRRLRAEGRVPAIIYGRSAPLAVSIDGVEFSHAFRHVSENTLIDVAIGKEVRHVIVKDYSMDTLRGNIIHLDFLEIEKGKALRTHIPLAVAGSSIGVRSGGVFEQPAHEVEIECLPRDMPETIEMDISNLQIGESFHVSDLQPIKGVRVLSNPDMVLCHVATVRAIQVEEPSDEETEADSAEDAADTDASAEQ